MVGLAEGLGGGEEVAVGLEEGDEVGGGDAEACGGLGEAGGVGVEGVEDECGDGPESGVLSADGEAVGGGGRAALRRAQDCAGAAGDEAFGHDGGQVGGLVVERAAVLAGEVHAEASQGGAAVGLLEAGVLGLCGDGGGAVAEADGGGDFVAVLPAGAGGAVGVDVALGQQGGVVQSEIVVGWRRGHGGDCSGGGAVWPGGGSAKPQADRYALASNLTGLGLVKNGSR